MYAHPYGRQPTVESIASLRRADLEGFYRAGLLGARRAVVTIVGDVSRKQAEAIAQQADGKPAVGQLMAAPETASLPVASEQRIAHSAAQAHLMIGCRR